MASKQTVKGGGAPGVSTIRPTDHPDGNWSNPAKPSVKGGSSPTSNSDRSAPRGKPAGRRNK